MLTGQGLRKERRKTLPMAFSQAAVMAWSRRMSQFAVKEPTGRKSRPPAVWFGQAGDDPLEMARMRFVPGSAGRRGWGAEIARMAIWGCVAMLALFRAKAAPCPGG